jgi:hypothetical protein
MVDGDASLADCGVVPGATIRVSRLLSWIDYETESAFAWNYELIIFMKQLILCI